MERDIVNMNYCKNEQIRAYPDISLRSYYYTCIALENNGRVIQIYPTQDGRIFENVVAWRNSIPQSAEVVPHIVVSVV